MPNTYVALATQTVAVATPSVTFTSIPQGYTDLVVVCTFSVSSASDLTTVQVGNGSVDTGSNYSMTFLLGNGSTATSGRYSNQTAAYVTRNLGGTTTAGGANSIVHFQNYSNTTTFKTILNRSNQVDSSFPGVEANVNLWRNTAAINTMTFARTAGNFAVGSTFSLYGIANADQGAAKATGGIITEDSQYWYHTFGASGAFVPKQSLSCDVLVVAGGGSGGLQYAGGGGAGGFVYTSSASLTSGASYTCTIGAGAAKAVDSGTRDGSNGSNSTVAGTGLTTITATGGGLGGGDNGNVPRNGGNGGSGGGGSATSNGMGSGGVGSQGSNGAAGVLSTVFYGGGGGGFSEAGNTDGLSFGGDGTSTYSSWGIATGTGQNVSGTYFYAGGGGGSANVATAPEGGSGGGGAGGKAAGGQTDGVAGTANTGGGGGAGWGGSNNSGAGGSGVVIVRYSK